MLITYTRPLRRTTRQARWRAFSDLSDDLTFMAENSGAKMEAGSIRAGAGEVNAWACLGALRRGTTHPNRV